MWLEQPYTYVTVKLQDVYLHMNLMLHPIYLKKKKMLLNRTDLVVRIHLLIYKLRFFEKYLDAFIKSKQTSVHVMCDLKTCTGNYLFE